MTITIYEQKCHFHAKTMYWVNIPKFTPGDIIQHFKRTMISKEDAVHDKYLYTFLGYARHTESNDVVAVYRAIYPIQDSINVFVRPLDMFMSKVDMKAYPDSKQEYRFVRYFGGIYEY